MQASGDEHAGWCPSGQRNNRTQGDGLDPVLAHGRENVRQIGWSLDQDHQATWLKPGGG